MKPDIRQLHAVFDEKIWGATSLEPWFKGPAGSIGEVAFWMPDGSSLPILVKFVFARERLSVQVHPDDSYALEHEGMGGKTEMMYVLAAEPGARMAAGFLEPLTRERARQAALSGEIERLLHWWPVSPGQVYFVPAGTVHALGAGVTVCEVQRPNAITYRLFDYGRDRELHLERGLDVARLETYPGPSVPSGAVLASCPWFQAERLEVTGSRSLTALDRFQLLVTLEGTGRIGEEVFAPGQVWHIPASQEPVNITAHTSAKLLRTFVPV